jgi:ribonuclease HI
MKPSNCPDPNGLTSRFLRDFANDIAPLLLPLFKAISNCRSIPASWRSGTVIPLPKSAGRWRPVTITSLLSRCWEKCILRRWAHYYEAHPAQYGFKQRTNCSHAIDRIIQFVEEALSFRSPTFTKRGNVYQHKTLVLALDLKDAFNNVGHDDIRTALKDLPDADLVLKWLHRRNVRIYSEDRYSDEIDTPRGVPQGSVLGPFLFNCVIASLLDTLEEQHTIVTNASEHARSSTVAYADDVTILISAPNLEELSIIGTHILDEIKVWSSTYGIPLSDKSKAIVIGDQLPPNLEIDLGLFKSSQTPLKVLGYHLDSKLTFTHHIHLLLQECQPLMRTLQAATQRLHPFAHGGSRCLYEAYLLSRLRSLAPIWHRLSSQSKASCEQLHAAAARAICKIPKTASSHSSIREAGYRELASIIMDTNINHFYETAAHDRPHERPGLIALDLPHIPVITHDHPLDQHRSALTGTSHLDRHVLLSATSYIHEADPSDEVKSCANSTVLALLSKAKPAITICTDGSVKSDSVAGAACIITKGDAQRETLLTSTPLHACSYTAEAAATLRALDYLIESGVSHNTIALVQDCQSLQKKTDSRPHLRAEPMIDLIRARFHLLMQQHNAILQTFVYSHVDNTLDDVDTAAKTAADTIPQQTKAWHIDAARVTRNRFHASVDAPTDTLRSTTLGHCAPSGPAARRTLALLPRGISTTLLRARTGVCPELGDAAVRHDAVPEPCPRCGEANAIRRGHGAAIRHVLACPAFPSPIPPDHLWGTATQLRTCYERITSFATDAQISVTSREPQPIPEHAAPRTTVAEPP